MSFFFFKYVIICHIGWRRILPDKAVAVNRSFCFQVQKTSIRGNTSHVKLATHVDTCTAPYFWRDTIMSHSYGCNFASFFNIINIKKQGQFNCTTNLIKHLHLLIWNEKPQVSWIMNAFLSERLNKDCGAGQKVNSGPSSRWWVYPPTHIIRMERQNKSSPSYTLILFDFFFISNQ